VCREARFSISDFPNLRPDHGNTRLMDWRKIQQDLALAMGSQLLQKLTGLVVIMVLVRHLDKAVMGQFFLAGVLTTFLALATELGVNRHLMRRAAQEPKDALTALGQVLVLRLPLMLVGYALLVGAVFVVQRELTVPVLLTGLYVLLQEYYYTFSSLMLGLRRVGMRLLSMLIGQSLTVALVLLAVALGAGLAAVLLAYVIANLAMVVLTAVLIRRKIGPFPLRVEAPEAWRIVQQSLPFFLLGVLGTIHFKVDSLMLGLLRGYEQVATYEAAYKVLEVSRFVVRPAAMIFFPLCSEVAARGDWHTYRLVLRKLVATTGALSLAMAGGVLIVAGWVVSLVYGPDYAESSAVLRILFLSVPAVYLGFVASFLAPSLNLERRAVTVTGACLLLNVVLNLFWIPGLGARGAAWATLVSETVLAAWLLGMIATKLTALQGVAVPATGASSPVLGGVVSGLPQRERNISGHDAAR
jgi:O-antigen/teichoic acid export membrane protein